MSGLTVSHSAAAMGCPYHKMLAAAQAAGCPVADVAAVPEDQVVGMVRRYQDNPAQALSEMHKTFGAAFEVETGSGRVRFDHDPDTARKVLLETEGPHPTFKKSGLQTHGLAGALGENNLLLASGKEWETSRRALSDFFSPRQMKTDEKIHLMATTLDRHLEALPLNPDGTAEVDLASLFRRATLDVALRTLFSAQPSTEDLDKLTRSYEVINKQVGREWLLPASVTGLRSPDQEYRQALDCVNGWATSLVEARLKMEDQPQDALAALMTATDPETGKPFDKNRLIGEVKNLMLAGHETTANLITWTLTDLARSPVKQNQLRAEVIQACGNGIPTAEAMKQMGNVFSTWREEATEHPPNFLIAREALNDTTVGPKEHPVDIKAGTTVLISTQHANAQDARGMFSFGGGKRFCLGINMARQETELAIGRFLQKFEVTDSGERGVRSGLTQLPDDTLVRVKARA